MARIIFHVPYAIDYNHPSGSQIRPVKMLNAFIDCGYEVDMVIGYAKERKASIKKIKKSISQGVKYDFIYSESSTAPTALTETHHLPISPFLDFSFFRFCKKRDIKIALFYRDIHWAFDEYSANLSRIKSGVAKFFYRYDLRKYNKLLDVLYLPTIQMKDYIPVDITCDIKCLLPASDSQEVINNKPSELLSFVYVGGLGDLYDLTMFAKAVSNLDTSNFNLCTRDKEWQNQKYKYKDYLKNITIHHKSGKDLIPLFEDSTFGVLFLYPTKYSKFAIAVKLFEYMAFGKPVIATKGTAIGEFVNKNNIGWALDYKEESIQEFLTWIKDNPEDIEIKKKNISLIQKDHTWKSRAKQVINELGV
jgi:glycosyltransferase involved in cell wall biosynthesis